MTLNGQGVRWSPVKGRSDYSLATAVLVQRAVLGRWSTTASRSEADSEGSGARRIALRLAGCTTVWHARSGELAAGSDIPAQRRELQRHVNRIAGLMLRPALACDARA
jgi:hypothetical protein